MNNLSERDYRNEPRIAIYWDFENVHISLSQLEGYDDEPFRAQQPVVNVTSIMDYAASLGEVCVNRAYGNWQFYGRYRDSLSMHGIELIQLFPMGSRNKNGADIKMCVDLMEDLVRRPHIDVYLVITGDSDFVSIAQKVRQHGKRIIGIGIRERTSRFWVQVCNEFKFYDLLQRHEALPELAPTEGSAPSDALPAAHALLVSVVRRLATQSGESRVEKVKVKPLMLRVDPGFDESRFGFATFSEFIASCSEHVEDVDNMLTLRGDAAHLPSPAQLSPEDHAKWQRAVVAAMTFLVRKVGNEVPMAALKPLLQRLEPSFDQRNMGFPTLLAFLRQFPGAVDVRGEGANRFIVLLAEQNDGGYVLSLATPYLNPSPEMLAAAVPFHAGSLHDQPALNWPDYYQRLGEVIIAAGLDPDESKAVQGVMWRSHAFNMLPDKRITLRDDLAGDGKLAAHIENYLQSQRPRAAPPESVQAAL